MSTIKPPKTKLSDSQLVILSNAARRDNGAVLPLPRSLKAKGGAATRVLQSLINKGLIAETPAKGKAETWRETEEGVRLTLVVTEAGLEALGVEPDVKAAASKRLPGKPAVRQGTKQAILIELLNRKGGATIAELQEAIGWQAHSVRGAISGTLKKKLGLAVTAEPRKDGSRSYRITGQAAS